MSSTSGATATQAWAILKRHARDEISPLRLIELCRDNDRVSALVTVYNSRDNQHMLMVDLSRQRMTLETLNHLMRLARSCHLKQFILQLAWGGDPNDPIPQPLSYPHARMGNDDTMANPQSGSSSIPSYHLCLRAPKGSEMFLSDGTNAVTSVHREWDRIQRLSDSLRRGQLPGVTGQMLRDVVVVGQGVSVMALRFVYLALCKDATATIGRKVGMTRSPRRMEFVTTSDPVRVAATVADWDPATTLIVTIALSGKEETLVATGLLQSWLFQALGVVQGRRPAEQVLSKHMVFISSNERLAQQRKPETIFVLPEHSRSEPFSSFSAATLLPLAIVFGWPIVEQFLNGGHDMDSHFVETNPRHNLPVLLALTDVWNESFLHSTGRIVTPYADAFAAYPAFCAVLESQTCGGNANPSTMAVVGTQVVDGGLNHAYDRSLYQSNKSQPTELVMMLDSQLASNATGLGDIEEVYSAQDYILCSMFAHADELAFGSATAEAGKGNPPLHPSLTNHGPPSDAVASPLEKVSEGNRPSVLVLCGQLDAFACGQFVAMAEHRAVVKARLWDIDPFVRESASTLRASRLDVVKETLANMLHSKHLDDDDDDDDDDDNTTNLSTKTILRHYSNLVRDQRGGRGASTR